MRDAMYELTVMEAVVGITLFLIVFLIVGWVL